MSGRIEDLRWVENAEIRKAGHLAGHLSRTREGTEFTYDPDYEGPAVATSLPRGAPPVRASAGAVPPYFAGLLPEGRRLAAVRTALKTSADDDFSLLLATAHDAIGAVQVVPLGWVPPPPSSPEPLDRVRFAELMARVLGPEGADRVASPTLSRTRRSSWTQRGQADCLRPPPRSYTTVTVNPACWSAASTACCGMASGRPSPRRTAARCSVVIPPTSTGFPRRKCSAPS
ncbi:MAG: hypothetical protein GXP62_10860 [Oligoflexia bacterium]|nr:hypothetical protein [Oligoflexia bacterium]